jgi:hypothetical protein
MASVEFFMRCNAKHDLVAKNQNKPAQLSYICAKINLKMFKERNISNFRNERVKS